MRIIITASISEHTVSLDHEPECDGSNPHHELVIGATTIGGTVFTETTKHCLLYQMEDAVESVLRQIVGYSDDLDEAVRAAAVRGASMADRVGAEAWSDSDQPLSELSDFVEVQV